MPQMAPMNWLFLYFMFTMIFMIFNFFNYYMFLMNNKKIIIKNNYIKKIINWMW
uniref:ATP synthase F0 subunit 8 n=1 Tax=Lebiini sp. 2 ACP-2013 TaxID=1434541 RepID=A0A3G5FNT7_9CARA|nr:ATP synthase F0 subunit 8 [Lebiini sp. 2 ACP-2013]